MTREAHHLARARAGGMEAGGVAVDAEVVVQRAVGGTVRVEEGEAVRVGHGSRSSEAVVRAGHDGRGLGGQRFTMGVVDIGVDIGMILAEPHYKRGSNKRSRLWF